MMLPLWLRDRDCIPQLARAVTVDSVHNPVSKAPDAHILVSRITIEANRAGGGWSPNFVLGRGCGNSHVPLGKPASSLYTGV